MHNSNHEKSYMYKQAVCITYNQHIVYHISKHILLKVSVYINMYVCLFVCLFECHNVFVCMYVYVYVYVYVCVCMCMYVCIYVYSLRLTEMWKPPSQRRTQEYQMDSSWAMASQVLQQKWNQHKWGMRGEFVHYRF